MAVGDGMRDGEPKTVSQSKDCEGLSHEDNLLLEDLVKKGLRDAIWAIKQTSTLAGCREPDVALSIGLSVMLSVMVKARRELTHEDGSNSALEACVETFNAGCAQCDIPYRMVPV